MPRPNRVLFVINDLQRAGAETQLVRLACALGRERWEPRIALLKRRNDFEDELRAAGVPVFALDRRGPWDLGAAARLRRLIHEQRPDVVHSYLFLASLLAVPLARRAGVPAVIVSQRCSYDATVAQPWRWIARRVHRRADRILVNSQAALREEQAAGIPLDRLLYVPNGIAQPDTPPHTAPATSEARGLPNGPFVACVAHLAREKGHGHLLAAWASVRTRVPGATLVLVGDGPLRAELKAQARDAGMEADVRFLGRREDAPQIMAAADLVVLASDTEGMPNAVLEAMAAGRAVVATRVGGIPDLVIDDVTGLLVPPARPGALADAVVALLGDAARRAKLGDAARARAREHFSMEAVTRATAAVYEARLEGRTRPRVRMIAGQFWPVRGGSENQCRRLAAELSRQGVPVEVWTRHLEPTTPRAEVIDDVAVRRLGPILRGVRVRRLERYLFMASLLGRIVRRRRDYDVLHVHQVLYPAVVASVAARIARRPVIARIAGSGESSDFRWLGRGLGLNRWLVRRLLTRIVAVDPVTRGECLAAGFAPRKIVGIPNGVAVPETRPERVHTTAEFVWTGVLRPEKRVDLLLLAWSLAGTPGRLRIVGDGEERTAVEAAARQAANVELTGEIPDPSSLLEAADVLVLPSDAEGMSNSLLEAMAAGCACIATAVGGNVDLLGGSGAPIPSGGYVTAEAGLLVNAGDAAGLAAAIGALGRSSELRTELGAAAHARCRRRFSIGAVAGAYRALYDEIAVESLQG